MKRRRLFFILLFVGWLLLTEFDSVQAQDGASLAQQNPLTYTVVSGDTMYGIAARFDVTIDAIAAANNIADVRLLNVGQVLLIPGGTPPPAGAASSTTGAASTDIPTTFVRARPGDTLQSLAARHNQPAEMLATLNNLSATARLFPGKPIAIPLNEESPEPLRFGAITSVQFPGAVAQGRTTRLVVDTLRPITLSATFGELNLPIQPIARQGLRHFSFLPVNSLLEPGIYPLTLTYLADNTVPVSRTWLIQVSNAGYAFQTITLPPEKSALLEQSLVQSELAKVAATWSPITQQLYWTDAFSRPIDLQFNTTSPFGIRRTYNDGTLQGFHAGQDFGAPVGVPVVAPGSGVVVLAEPLQVRGNAVIIDHGGGVYSGYWHLNELKVSPGQTVTIGDVIGLVGTTGLSTGAHLHWELRIYGVAVDPMQFLSEALIPPTLYSE